MRRWRKFNLSFFYNLQPDSFVFKVILDILIKTMFQCDFTFIYNFLAICLIIESLVPVTSE